MWNLPSLSPFLSPLRSVIEPTGRFQNVVGKESRAGESRSGAPRNENSRFHRAMKPGILVYCDNRLVDVGGVVEQVAEVLRLDVGSGFVEVAGRL